MPGDYEVPAIGPQSREALLLAGFPHGIMHDRRLKNGCIHSRGAHHAGVVKEAQSEITAGVVRVAARTARG